jgi:transposase
LTDEERTPSERLAHSRTAPARLVERARIIWSASQGLQIPTMAKPLGIKARTVRTWLKRFMAHGVRALEDTPRPGRPVTYTPDVVAEVMATALTAPQALGLPFRSWTRERLATCRNAQQGMPIKRSRSDELLLAEGLRWRPQETWLGERVDPDFAQQRGASEPLSTAPPAGSSRRVQTNYPHGTGTRPDAQRFGWHASPHTRGFYARTATLYHHARGTPMKRLCWMHLPGGRWRIDWRRTHRGR